MAQTVTLNGVSYSIPAYNDTGYAQGVGNLTSYLVAVSSAFLSLQGGSFFLTADADFGPNYGLKAIYLKSRTTNPASAGVVRLAKTDAIEWRNNANGGNVVLSLDGSDNPQVGSAKILLSGAVVDADINAAAAIAYSKLALTGSVVNADVSASAAIAYSKLALSASIVNADVAPGAAIAYSKLSLTGAVVNADIGVAAAIAYSKLAALTASRALVSDGSGVVAVSAVTATELGYVAGVTSAIQTQLNNVVATSVNPTTLTFKDGAGRSFTSVTSNWWRRAISATQYEVSAYFQFTSDAASTDNGALQVAGFDFTLDTGGSILGSGNIVNSGATDPRVFVTPTIPSGTTARFIRNNTSAWGSATAYAGFLHFVVSHT